MRKQQILNFERLMNENLGDMAHSVELDHEVQLARSELYKLAKYAIKLHNMLKDADPEQGLESWVQADITKSAESISKVFHSLEYEMKVSSNTQDLGSTTSPAANSDSSLPFESAVRNRSRNKYKESLSLKLKKKTITEAPASNHEWEGNHGAAQGPAAKPKATRQVARKPSANNQANYFQQQRSGGAAPAAKPAAPTNQANYFQQQRSGGAAPAQQQSGGGLDLKAMAQRKNPNANTAAPAAKPAAQQANFAQGGGGAAPAAKPAAKPAASTKEYHKANPNLPMDNPLNPYSPNFDIASLSPADQQKWKAQMATPQFKSRQQQKIIAYDQNAQTTTKGGATQDANAASDATQRPTNTGTAQQQGANQKISSPEPEVDKGFQPTHFHKGNLNNKIPLQYKNGKWFWQEDGVVKPWVGDVNDRGWLGSASVDGEIVNGKEVPYGDDETFADRQAAKPAAPTEPGKVDPGLAAAAADPKNASYTAANLPGPEQPGKVDPGLQQALNKGGQQPAPQQNVAQAPAAELPAVNKGGQQPAPQTVSAEPAGQQPSNAGSTEAKKNSDGTYTQPGEPAQRFGRSNYNSKTQLPLTPNVEFVNRMNIKFKGQNYGFAGPDKMPPKTGIDISIPNKYMMKGGANLRGKGYPVRLSGGAYYRLT